MCHVIAKVSHGARLVTATARGKVTPALPRDLKRFWKRPTKSVIVEHSYDIQLY